MNAEIYEPLWANTAPSILKSNYKTSNLSHKQQKLSSLGFLTILTVCSLTPAPSHILRQPRPGRRAGVHPRVCTGRATNQHLPGDWQPRDIRQKEQHFNFPNVFLQQSHTWHCQPVFHLPVLFMESPGRQNLENNQNAPQNHSVMEPGRQLVATASKQPLHNEKKGGAFLRAESFGLCFLCSLCKRHIKSFSCITLK